MMAVTRMLVSLREIGGWIVLQSFGSNLPSWVSPLRSVNKRSFRFVVSRVMVPLLEWCAKMWRTSTKELLVSAFTVVAITGRLTFCVVVIRICRLRLLPLVQCQQCGC